MEDGRQRRDDSRDSGATATSRRSTAASRRTTSTPRRACSARCCCRAMSSTRSASSVCYVDHFYKPAHQHIYAAIRGLIANGQPVDVVTVADELRRNGLLDEIGGAPTLLELQNATPAISNAVALRQDRQGHGAAAPADRRRQRDRRDRLPRARRRHQGARRGRDEGLRDRRGPHHRLHPLAQRPAADGDGPAAGDVRARRHRSPARPTGSDDLDEMLSGLQPSTLNIIGARPAMGKTQPRPGHRHPRRPAQRQARCWSSRWRWATTS